MFALITLGQAGVPALAGLYSRLTAFVARRMRGFSEWRALNEIARLDDRMLKDIGLLRADIETAESLPKASDRLALLVCRRLARRKARTAQNF